MQKHELRQIIREELSNARTNQHLNEAMSSEAAHDIGYHIGPNSRKKVDETSPEAIYIKDIADQFYNTGYPISQLRKNKIISAFIQGFVDSVGSNQYRNEGLPTTMIILARLGANGFPPKGQSLGTLK